MKAINNEEATLQEWENEISDNLNELVDGTSKLSLEKQEQAIQSVDPIPQESFKDKDIVEEGPASIKGNYPESATKPEWKAGEIFYSVYLLIEDRYCGGLIGRQGKSIAAIRQVTGATICLQDRRIKFDNHLPKRALKIYGPAECVQKAIIATAHRLLEVKAANLAYKNNTEVSTLPEFPTYEITILSPVGVVAEKFRSGGHVVIETFCDWELVEVWGVEKEDSDNIEDLPFSELCMEIVKESGLGTTPIDESRLATAHVSRARRTDGYYRQQTKPMQQGYNGNRNRGRYIPHHQSHQPPRPNYQMNNPHVQKVQSQYQKPNSVPNMAYGSSPSFALPPNQNFPSYKVASTNYNMQANQNPLQTTFAPFSNIHGSDASSHQNYGRAQEEAWPKPNTGRDLYQPLDSMNNARQSSYPVYGAQPDTRQQYSQGVSQGMPDNTMGANLYYLPRMNPDWEDI